MQGYVRKRRLAWVLGLALAAAAAMLALASVGLGAMDIPPAQVARIIWGQLSGQGERLAANQVAVVWEIRLPRVLCALLVGAGLSAAGAVFQSLLGNPLADPYTLGVSTGAAFGACAAIYINLMWSVALPTTPFAFAAALAALGAVLLIARRGGGFGAANLIVAGMIVSSVLSAAISFLKMLAGENVSAIVYWMMGSLSSKAWADVAVLLPLTAAGILAAYFFASDLNALALGERAALSLGVNVKRTRLILLAAGALLTAACVSVGGVIGFVGLIVPHMLRMALSSDNRLLIPLSALAGGVLLLAADDAARLLGNGDIPVGVLTTLIGGPFFLYLFLHRRGARPC